MIDSPFAPSIAQIFMEMLRHPDYFNKRADTPPWQGNLAIDLPTLPALRPCDLATSVITANLATLRPCGLRQHGLPCDLTFGSWLGCVS